MASVQLVHLTTATGPFHARVLAARLGAEGVLTQLRGAVDGPYPMGAVAVYVPADELGYAQEILVLDAAEAHLEPEAERARPSRAWVWPAAGAVVLVGADLLATLV